MLAVMTSTTLYPCMQLDRENQGLNSPGNLLNTFYLTLLLLTDQYVLLEQPMVLICLLQIIFRFLDIERQIVCWVTWWLVTDVRTSDHVEWMEHWFSTCYLRRRAAQEWKYCYHLKSTYQTVKEPLRKTWSWTTLTPLDFCHTSQQPDLSQLMSKSNLEYFL